MIEVLRRHALYGMEQQTISKAAFLILNQDFLSRVLPAEHRRRIDAVLAEYIAILQEMIDEVVHTDKYVDSELRAVLTHDLVDQSGARYEPKRGRDPKAEADQYVYLVTQMVGIPRDPTTKQKR